MMLLDAIAIPKADHERLLRIEAAAQKLLALPHDEFGKDFLAALLRLSHAVTPFTHNGKPINVKG